MTYGALRRLGITIVETVVSLAIVAGIWVAVLNTKDVSSYIAKTPTDVWNYLFSGAQAGAHRSDIGGLLAVTMGNAGLGLLSGVVGAVLVAMAFALAKPVEYMFMPLAMLLRTVPLLAMAPVIYIVFGNGKVTAALVGAVVVFFPILVNMALGFRSVSSQLIDLIVVNGGNRWTVVTRAALPAALPYFFAALRIAVPGAIMAAMLYEWLFTYTGLGAGIVSAKTDSDYPKMWTITVVATISSVLAYTITTAVESLVLERFIPDSGRRK
ncbi:ABC transporter permease [Gordonia sp. DT30]|uniref:ABC transporter permease n=1 Tax=unclassified Gordonia (in: high G+C Gram-positive bacteria) TaxID=2657482 RepID=UPI003CE9B939